MKQFSDIYQGRRILVTGHTGFKGSWLSLWLKELGADVCGIALDPDTNPNHFDLLNLEIADYRTDIRDTERVQEIVQNYKPELVFHLAAQPLVRRSYKEPINNWSSNVMGTANVLEACRNTDSVTSIIAITTDKVYANREWPWGYREIDTLGGYDPYSASKAACELLIDSYRNSFFSEGRGPLLASVRAGNVIGGGDWSEDRLIPDLVKSVENGETLVIRSPNATRPWQHVLDCLSGYLQLGEKLIKKDSDFSEAWNFGPYEEDNQTVSNMLKIMQSYWPESEWNVTKDVQPHEANLLYLDHTKARTKLHWEPVWKLEDAVKHTANWYRHYHNDSVILSTRQLAEYVEDAARKGVCWVN